MSIELDNNATRAMNAVKRTGAIIKNMTKVPFTKKFTIPAISSKASLVRNEDATHASPRDDLPLSGFEQIPVTDPEIKLPVLRA